MKKKSQKINLIICAVAFVAMILYMYFADGKGVLAALRMISWPFLLLAMGCMAMYWLMEALSLHALLRKVHKSMKFRETMSVTVIGQYYNAVTPFATGGQPFQAYYIMRYGGSFSSGVTALLSRFIVYQFMLTIYCFALFMIRLTYVMDKFGTLELVLLIAGIALTLGVTVGLLILALWGSFAAKIADLSIRLLHKLHIVKNLEGRRAYIAEEMSSYRKNFAFLRTQPLLLLRTCLYTLIQLTAYFAVTATIYYGFGLQGTDLITILACQSFVMMISSVFPQPGAVGAAEGSYGIIFGPIFGTFTTFTMFIWRILTFYLPIAIGIVFTIILEQRHAKRGLIVQTEDDSGA
jgi:uncharacterized protein (TIRG00374 family)